MAFFSKCFAARQPEIYPGVLAGPVIGCGTVKTCFLHKDKPDRCLKVCGKENLHILVREVRYREYLMRKGISAYFMPAYYGAFRTGELFGFEEECFLEKSCGGVWDRVRTLDEAVGDPSTDLQHPRERLLALKEESISKNILITDPHGANILIAEKDGVERLLVIDGYGTPEFVPLPQWFRPLGRLRKWRNLEDHLPFLI